MDGTPPAPPPGPSREGSPRVRRFRAPRARGAHSRGAPPREAPRRAAPRGGSAGRQIPLPAASSWLTLSGGEIQRLGLARAFAHAGAARLLILDDATSSLDTVTEMQVSEVVTSRLRGRTRLIVAHRVATAARADLVAWLDNGRIRGLAPHERLWLEPDYRALFGTTQPGAAERAGTADGPGAAGGTGAC
jgi:ATP-binding cassette subfamily B protein